MHCFPVDVIDPGGQARRETVVGRDAKQPAPQPVRTRQLRGISRYQARGNENVTGGGDCRIRVRPQPPGAAAQHCVTMPAGHVGEHRRAFPLSLGLPEPAHQSGIGMPSVACGNRRHPHPWPVGSDRQQDATACVPAYPGIMKAFVHSCRENQEVPMPLDEIIWTMETTDTVLAQARRDA
jgi:hypothetical protein